MNIKINVGMSSEVTYPMFMVAEIYKLNNYDARSHVSGERKMAQSKKLTAAQSKKLKGFTTKSAKIRYLDSLNRSRSEIVAWFKESGSEIRYQHVRNVLITPITKARES